MTAWTSPKTWASSNTLTAAELNEQVRDNEKNLDERLVAAGITSGSPTSLKQLKGSAYGCILIRTNDVNIGDATDTTLAFATGAMTELMDTDGFHSGASNTSRITIPSGGDGWYDVGACVEFDSDADGYRDVSIEMNGTGGAGTVLVADRRPSAGNVVTRVTVGAPVSLDAGDYIVCTVRHTAGNVVAVKATNYSPMFWCVRRFAT